MTATVLTQAGDQLGVFLPRLAGAIVLAIAGFLVAALLGRIVRRALIGLGVDSASARIGLPAVLERAQLGDSLSRLIGRAVRLSIIVVVLFASLSLLGLGFLSQALNEAVLFIPRLLIALALVLIGVVAGGFARERIERTSVQMDLPIAIAPVAQAVIIVLFGLTAALQVGISTGPILLILTIGLIAITATVALAFGLGSREIARSLSAARYARADFSVGETVRVGELRGRIERIDSAATVLRVGDDRIRVPNRVLIEGVVTVEERAGESM